MNPSDLVVICAESVPINQAIDLMKWWAWHHPEEVTTPSVFWWGKKHADDIWKSTK